MTITDIYQLFLKHKNITTDSRHCPPNSIFLALKGKTFNGNAFANNALQQGASYAIIDQPSFAIHTDKRYILVNDCLTTLQQLALLHRQSLHTTVLAITGSNGKTTTKELLAAVLSSKYNVLYSQGNLNNHIGVPLTLLRLTHNHNIAVIEMGANHPGEINTLAHIAAPNHALITNIGRAHLQGFGSLQGVIRAKGELYDYIKHNSPNGFIFLNSDDKLLIDMANQRNLTNRIYYGTLSNLNNTVTGILTSCSPFLNFKWHSSPNNSPHNPFHIVNTHLIGSYNLYNMLAAAAVAHFFNIDDCLISTALANYIPLNFRSQLTRTPNNTLILDAYNANPSSMAAAIRNFSLINAPNKMVILAQMDELGSHATLEHRKILSLLLHSNIPHIWLVGKLFIDAANSPNNTPSPQSLSNNPSIIPQLRLFPNIDNLKRDISTLMPRNFFILLKGSHSSRLFELANLL